MRSGKISMKFNITNIVVTVKYPYNMNEYNFRLILEINFTYKLSIQI